MRRNDRGGDRERERASEKERGTGRKREGERERERESLYEREMECEKLRFNNNAKSRKIHKYKGFPCGPVRAVTRTKTEAQAKFFAMGVDHHPPSPVLQARF